MATFIKQTISKDFEEQYVGVRKKEGRIFSLEEIRQLPVVSKTNPHFKEWQYRAYSFGQFKHYFQQKQPKRVLDLACGNGWMMYQLNQSITQFVGVEINALELQQAQTLLTDHSNIQLILGDVFALSFDQTFDLIYISAAIQYFANLADILQKLLSLLTPHGEIHIFDSPFYANPSAAKQAAKRSQTYYTQIGHPEMADYYHHHTITDLADYNYQILHQPKQWQHRIRRKLGFASNPFPWLVVRRF